MEDLIKNGSPLPVNVKLEDEDECALYFTSGTTGAPKPVLIQQKSIMCTAIHELYNHKHESSDKFLMMSPLYHVAIGHMLGAVLAGGCTVLLTDQINPKNIIETIAKGAYIQLYSCSCPGPWISWMHLIKRNSR